MSAPWMPCCKPCDYGCLICSDWEAYSNAPLTSLGPGGSSSGTWFENGVAGRCDWTQEEGIWSYEDTYVETSDSEAILQNLAVGGTTFMNNLVVVSVTRYAENDVAYVLFRDVSSSSAYGVAIGSGSIRIVEIDMSASPWTITEKASHDVYTPAGTHRVLLCQEDLVTGDITESHVTARVPSITDFKIGYGGPISIAIADSVAMATGTVTGPTYFSRLAFYHGYDSAEYPECDPCPEWDVPPPPTCTDGCTNNDNPDPDFWEICEGFQTSSYIRFAWLTGISDGTCVGECNALNGVYELCHSGGCWWNLATVPDYGEKPCSDPAEDKTMRFAQDPNPSKNTVLDFEDQAKEVVSWWWLGAGLDGDAAGTFSLLYIAGIVGSGTDTHYVAPIGREFDTYNDLWGGTMHLVRPAPDDCTYKPTISVWPKSMCQPSICGNAASTYPAQELEVTVAFYNEPQDPGEEDFCSTDCSTANGTYLLKLAGYGETSITWNWDFELDPPIVCNLWSGNTIEFNWLGITSYASLVGGVVTLRTLPSFVVADVDGLVKDTGFPGSMGCGYYEKTMIEANYFCGSDYQLTVVSASPGYPGCCHAVGLSEWNHIGWSPPL